MKKYVPITLSVVMIISASFLTLSEGPGIPKSEIDSLRQRYLRSPDTWPRPHVGVGVDFHELAPLPPSPIDADSLKDEIHLGNLLFHDPRLSSSNQVSCFSCHAPDMNWTDGRRVSLGQDHKRTNRNTPTIENAWAQKSYFWDGRAKTLEEQAPHSIENPFEMNQDPALLPEKLSKIEGYKPFFAAAFGDSEITLDRITRALATFQRTFVSRKSDFDRFLEGDANRLTDEQVLGLHLFRTKARCVTCHNGPFFTDGNFHNVGLTYFERNKYEDLGRYHVTKDPRDVGKFKTPSLRNVMRTGPWFHNGLFDDILGVINMYNAGMARPVPNESQKNDPMFPETSHLLRPLDLTNQEKLAIVAFLEAITTSPRRMIQPDLPE